MVPGEQKIMEEMKTTYNKYFVPLAWCTALITRARKEGRIKDDFAVKTLIDVSLPRHSVFLFYVDTMHYSLVLRFRR